MPLDVPKAVPGPNATCSVYLIYAALAKSMVVLEQRVHWVTSDKLSRGQHLDGRASAGLP